MSPETTYQFLIFLLALTVVLEIIARRLALPPAAAFIAGGIALALIPGVPSVEIDPELVLLVFMPPLLMHSAYFTVWHEFKRYFTGIASLALGAVVFTTAAVGVVFHVMFPNLPWAVGFALGAIVAPPDAVSASAVLERLRLPSRITTLLAGESLVNDASGLVLFKFAVAAALTGAFDPAEAAVMFAWEVIGGVSVGIATGWLGILVIRRLKESQLIISASLLLATLSYIAAEWLGCSGVLSTVATGLMVGWHQHEDFSASTRLRVQAFWQALAFLMESLLFVLIGLSLHSVLERTGGLRECLAQFGIPVTVIVVVVILARFVWLLGTAVVGRFVPSASRSREASSLATATVISWAGMRGVVTLAGALSLPSQMPGRDFVLVAAFAVIIVTVLLQGTTLGFLASLLKVASTEEQLSEQENGAIAARRVAEAQYMALQKLSRNQDGSEVHPRLVEQFKHRAELAARFEQHPETHQSIRTEHYEAVLKAIQVGRSEISRMRKSGEIQDSVMRHLERELDLQELSAESRK